MVTPGQVETLKERRVIDAASARLMRRATYASVAIALLLIVVKIVAWLLTDSVAMLSTLIDSILDAFASLVNLLAVRHALAPPDREHRFGHGKAEPLAAMAQSAFICGSAIFLVIEAGQRLYAPQPIAKGEVGIAVMLFSIVMTFLLVQYQRFVIRRTRSLAIKADSLHYVGDLLVNAAVIVAIMLSWRLGWYFADPIFAIGIAGYIIWNAWQIARQALDMLMDRELPDEQRQRIRELALAHQEVVALHDLRTRAAGPQTFIQMHLEMDGKLSLWRAHEIAEQVENELREVFPGAEVIIHQDPHGVDEGQASFAG